MLVQDILDLAGPDLEPRRVDLVFLAIDDVEPALGVHEPHIAGVEPASGHGVLAFLRLVPVAQRDLGTGHDDLTDLPDG